MAKIKEVKSREILNGKGEPAIETTVTLSDGKFATASCPSGTTIGNYEALDLRDRNSDRFLGRGVLTAVSNVNKIIAPAILGMDAGKQQEVDKKIIELDGTQNKSRLGANATLSVSMAVAKAAAQSSVLPLFLYLRQYLKLENSTLKIPTPIFDVISGNKFNGPDFKNFMIICATSKTYSESILIANIIYNSLKNNLRTNNLSTLVSDQGGFSPQLSSNEEALSYIKQSIEDVNLRLGFDVFMGIDSSGNTIYQEKRYKIKDKAMSLSSGDLSEFYEEISKKYSVIYLEDPFSEEDWDAWPPLTLGISSLALVVSDSLTSTNPYRLQMALDKKAVSGIVIKPGQIGTVMEALAVLEIARQSGLKIIASVRSEETNDDFIADFAVATSCDYLRFGSLSRGEMISKYNRLLEIETTLKTL